MRTQIVEGKDDGRLLLRSITALHNAGSSKRLIQPGWTKLTVGPGIGIGVVEGPVNL